MAENKIIYYIHKRVTDKDFEGGQLPTLRIYVKDKAQRKLITKLTKKWYLTAETMQGLEAMGFEFRQYINKWA